MTVTIEPILARFLRDEVFDHASSGASDRFLEGLEATLRWAVPRNAELLAVRAGLQAELDAWHVDGGAIGGDDYEQHLRDIGYLVPDVAPFTITTTDVDPEISSQYGPQLVVPVTNARYALNAANARWGSLYDSLYGTDALGDPSPSGPYDPERGRRVVAWAREFLDDAVPLATGSHVDVSAYQVVDEALAARLVDGSTTGLADPAAFVGYRGDPSEPAAIVLEQHGLGIELIIDRDHPIGADDRAGIADVILESALTTIVDFEDSVACVDVDDKVEAYRNWLGLMTGELRATLVKDGRTIERELAPDRRSIAPDGSLRSARGRALLLARVVGHLMDTDAVRLDGQPVPEGIVDAFVVTAIALRDRSRPEALRNSRHGSVYLVKPKMHGPEEVRFACDVLAAVEASLDIDPNTIKLGIMDEERRTTLNLRACIREASDRVVFINTGFLDRTGDEIHTSMHAGPMVRKNDMRHTEWIRAYEDWNVDCGLACGFAGRAQIGKGMWAAPERMADMLAQKIGHPNAGANCAWVPSPTAATLHATHYHRVDVAERQRQLTGSTRATLDDLVRIPVEPEPAWSTDEIRAELDNNLQGILGYVVRWIDQGVGCSTVPDLSDIGLMEDRATCRISSQHVANWLLHGIVTRDDVEAALRRMAVVVDRQNADDDAYTPMAPAFDGPAFLAARALVFEGTQSPSGYTEPILHAWRAVAKAAGGAPRRHTAP